MVLACLLASAGLFAQETKKPSGFSLGFGIGQYKNDFGLSVNVKSPWFLWESVAVKAEGLLLFNDQADWKLYGGAKLGLCGGSIMESADIRLYGEGGALILFPSADFSDKTIEIGGYGLFGFEFIMQKKSSGPAYYIELGANGIRAIANKITGNPHYVNGFFTTTGFRWYL